MTMASPVLSPLWQRANRLLSAKILSELMFEEVLSFTLVDQNMTADLCEIVNGNAHYLLRTASRTYSFEASLSVWGMLVINPDSITVKYVSEDGKPTPKVPFPEACQLLIDIQSQMKISDINLSGLLEEVQQTLYSDCIYLQSLDAVSAEAIVNMSEVSRQAYLSAHPKAIANKGRLGWGTNDLANYTPESAAAIQLRCVAVHNSAGCIGIAKGLDLPSLWQDSFGAKVWQSLQQKLIQECQLTNSKYNTDDFLLVPVHPWQLQRFIQGQFLALFADGRMFDLGDIPGEWIAQQSIRTLSAVGSQPQYDIKTAITILNTSCYRGIPGSFILHGPRLSAWLAEVVSHDSVLSWHGMRVQQEVAGVFCDHPYQEQVKGGAYRYREMLGCIWRERAEKVVPANTRVMSMATLMQVDSDGKSCVAALIESSELSRELWLRRLFRHVVVPLYHLMCQYGVALVAHGQNISVVLRNNQPVGCLIKDFHGDLRLIDQAFPELASLDEDIQQAVTRLPAHYLIHDLVTGHFVTVLRFVSPLLTEAQLLQNIDAVSEVEFYGYLADEIRQYQDDHPHLAQRFALFDLFTDTIAKVCINRVRFKIGYSDSDERPLPELGEPIPNPLLLSLKSETAI